MTTNSARRLGFCCGVCALGLNLPPEEFAVCIGSGYLLQGRDQVGVYAQRDRDIDMPSHLTADPEVCALAQEERCRGVGEIIDMLALMQHREITSGS